MATDAQIRSWAREQGMEVTARGAVPAHIRDAYEAHHPNGGRPPGDPPDDDQDVIDAPVPPDERPRNVRAAPASTRLRGWRRRAAAKGKKRKRSHPRVPLDDMISGAWGVVASAVGAYLGMPATGTMLRIQAPVAGAMLEDTAKDTLIDRILQPIARNTQTGEVVTVLTGPPILVAAIERNPSCAPIAVPLLRTLLLRWHKLAGPKLAALAQESQDFEDEFGQSVDAMIEMLLSQVVLRGAEEEPEPQAA